MGKWFEYYCPECSAVETKEGPDYGLSVLTIFSYNKKITHCRLGHELMEKPKAIGPLFEYGGQDD